MKNEERKQLLIKMEKVIGSSCFNGNIQNWGPNGQWLGEGRAFRYPLKLNKIGSRKVVDKDIPMRDLMTGRYAFGANQLHIIQALDEVLNMLQNDYGLKIGEKKEGLKADCSQKSECPICAKKVVDVDMHVSQSHTKEWHKYSDDDQVMKRLKGKLRCSGCGSFLKTRKGHDEKCPGTLL
ncbi:hypothetical protein KUW18_18800 [Halomonas sp. DP5Y7-2]|uniref:hypothetical protein n=1 Tax=Halomonas sp. DP5Y7-2 TaxID=2859076 RepID=UPI001C99B74C|nr:hypothetical protein [Halomonas sp. DP5Y7-2]MBY5986139.1 hypothetical protein [Halomonas sp. DP5Y7-2]